MSTQRLYWIRRIFLIASLLLIIMSSTAHAGFSTYHGAFVYLAGLAAGLAFPWPKQTGKSDE